MSSRQISVLVMWFADWEVDDAAVLEDFLNVMEEVYDEDVGRAGFEAEDGPVGLGPGVEAA